MDKRLWLGTVAVIAIAAAIGIAQRSNNPATSGGTLSTVAVSSPRPSSAAPVVPLAPDTAPSSPEGDAAPAERDLGDYLAKADAILAKAQGGDADAQYALYRLLFECDDGYRGYFDHRNKRRSLDEALQIASTRGPAMNIDDVNEIYQKCHRLKEGDSSRLGKAEDWLRKSADARNPTAQVVLAQKLFGEAVMGETAADAAKRDEAKKLARDALRSKDPAVVWEVGDLTLLFSDDEKATHDQWVWKVAACQRGYDCSHSAEWRKAYCRFDMNCQPYETGLDVIRRLTKSDYDQIEQEAKELNARLDADNFDDLGS
jgi:hypothetical protein